MRNIFAVMSLLLVTVLLGACGGSTGSTNVIQVYGSPAAADITPKASAPGTLLGGSVQGAVLPVFSNVSTVAGIAGTIGSDDLVGTLAKFYQPNGVTTDGKGNLYITDYWNHIIRKMELATGKVETFAGVKGIGGSANTADGPPTFYSPNAITSDGDFLYVTDANFTVRKINILDRTVTTLAGLAGNSGSVDHVTGSDARFNQLNGITNDAKYLYVTDSSNTIRWIDKVSGTVKTLAGSSGSVGSDDGIGSAARFNLPTRITCDGPNLYVCDFNNRTVRVIDIATGKVERIAGRTGVTGTPEALVADSNLFDQPNGITTDGTYLYITDTNNSTVRRLLLADRSIVTIAGAAGSYGTIDGNVSVARFHYPSGIVTDGKSLYLTDSANHTIRRIY